MERELLLLGLLRRQDMHGYQLHEFINNNLASCTDLKKPTAYHLLDKMEHKGWLDSAHEDNPSSNRPAKRIYRLTEAGEAAFQHLLRENLAGFTNAVFPGNIGLIFMDALPPADAFVLLNQRRHALTVLLSQMEDVPPHAGSLGLAIEHQVHHLKSELVWLDEVLARIHNQIEE